MAVLVPATEPREQKGTKNIRGWLEPSDPFFKVIDQIISDREKHFPRILKSAES